MAQSRRTAGNFILLGHTIDFVIYILIIVFRIVLNECLNKKGWYFRGQNICIIVWFEERLGRLPCRMQIKAADDNEIYILCLAVFDETVKSSLDFFQSRNCIR